MKKNIRRWAGIIMVQLFGLVGVQAFPAPAAWWRGEANAADSAGTNHGQIVGDLGYAAGKQGKAFNFKGTNGFVRIPASSSLNVSSMTMMAWIYPTDFDRVCPIAEYSAPTGWVGVHFELNGGSHTLRPAAGALYVNLRTPQGKDHDHYFRTDLGVVNLAEWQHVAFTYNAGTGRLDVYVNGESVGSEDLGTGFVPQTAVPLNIGHRPAGVSDAHNGAVFQGKMDEFVLIRQALTPDQVKAVYEGRNLKETSVDTPLLPARRPAERPRPTAPVDDEEAGKLANGWRLVGMGDFNADGQADIFWQHEGSGVLAVSLRNETGFSTLQTLPDIMPPVWGWKLIGIGDLSGDGRPDLIWQNPSGQMLVWHFKNLRKTGVVYLKRANVGWRLMVVGDFNQDERQDLLWRHGDGRVAIWYLNKTTFVSSKTLNRGQPVATAWRLAGAGDFDGDGLPDLAWQHKEGWISISLLDGVELRQSYILNPDNPVTAVWRLAAVADLNANGVSDFLWRSQDKRLGIWFMPSGDDEPVESASVTKKSGAEGWVIDPPLK